MNPFVIVEIIELLARLFELLVYFYFFWAFIFSGKFRKKTIRSWKTANFKGRFAILVEALFSLLVGLLPLWLLI